MNEILAPAGSVKALYAAVNAGADAVYIGGQLFGARAFAENPDIETLKRAIDYVHIHGKKIYLTVNTLLKNGELEEQLYDYLLPLYQQGLDAVIVQDLGVFDFIRKHFFKLDIHASTQMAVTGVESAAFLKNAGATRVVTARELSLSELKEIHEKVSIEIESFVHGAMCYGYSGMCLFSSMIGGRSGNRGRCAGSCRQPYEVYKAHKRLNSSDSLYGLSLKDMNTLSLIPDIIESGVYSLKIEGRMKSPEYVAGVVSIYRKYLDLYYEYGREGFRLRKQDLQNLSQLYSRSGSTTGYYQCYNSKNMVSFRQPAYKSENENFIREIHEQYCDKTVRRRAYAHIRLHEGKAMELTLCSYPDKIINITQTGAIVTGALKKPIDQAGVIKQLKKTGDSLIEFEDITIELGDNVFVAVSQLNELRRAAIQKFEEALLLEYRRVTEHSGSAVKNVFPYQAHGKTPVSLTESACCISCQVTTLPQLDCVLNREEISTVCISTDILTVEECLASVKRVLSSHKECVIEMPYIYRHHGKRYMAALSEKMSEDNDILNGLASGQIRYMIKNIDELGLMANTCDSSERKGSSKGTFQTDSSLYAFNRYAKKYLYHLGACKVTLPYELNYHELKKLADMNDELVIYGYVPLMVSAGCLNKNFNQCLKGSNEILNLRDRRGATFTAMCCCNFCYNIIYNCVPVSLLGVHDKVLNINTRHYRINLTIEDAVTAAQVLEQYIKVFYNHEDYDEISDFTRGHFNRGVD